MQAVNNFVSSIQTSEDKWHVLHLALVFNSIVGAAFLLTSLFVVGKWGLGAGFQPLTTASLHALYCWVLVQWVRRHHILHPEFAAGVGVMMIALLLQTASLWGSFSGGLVVGECVVQGSSERALSAFATLNFLGHLGLAGLAYQWRDDIGVGGPGSYTSIGAQGSYPPVAAPRYGQGGGLANGSRGGGRLTRESDGDEEQASSKFAIDDGAEDDAL